MKLFVTLLALGACTVSAFNTQIRRSPMQARRTTLMAESNVPNKVAAAALAALLTTSPVLPLVVSPQQAVAARSGGRAGGSGGFRSAPPPRAAAAPRVTNNNYYGGRPSGGGVVISPIISPFGYSPFGYSPFGGLGTGYALGAMSNGADRQQQYRMENQLGAEEAKVQALEKELEESKALNSKLEDRMDRLEQQQR
mmetsp:Transcript_859/g.1355  ORF Transcript_859/g.1355 Transcript_859/m.1355 type:complete len:196 (+) Transcript_859:40-627(+)|eukprot:CAMPEP_0205905010 /NCGR_PEP_ID=MMETSP1325-20131115/1093_1 /ASSEMBLY_ACC=CAM_ASM_000708 /TAXON_ID=236786 /ORGANISM="Florenciella sp., Strain RCC1007" /LENGTH=195 /DNA_ID=CAMNT_0053270877 /DNA_START=40 /DNA_END=627 /DNA_ORIENTATION=-